MIQCPGWKVHSLGGCNFGTVHEKTIKFSGFSFLDGYIDLTKFQQIPWGSGGNFLKFPPFHMEWPSGSEKFETQV